MKELNALWFLVVLSPSWFGQTAQTKAVTRPDDKQVRETTEAMNSVQKYCRTVESFSESHEPRLFAETHSGRTQSAEWAEFSSRAEWERAGKPKLIASAWLRNGNIIRVAMAFEHGNEDGPLYVDYCYQQNGKLARLASVPVLRTKCDDAYFRCQLTSGIEWLYLPNGQRLQVVNGMDRRLLKSEQTYFSTSKLAPPEYPNVGDLPFARVLR
jgi:nuclear transport factor 2 (NTF2) superfamily protein